MKYLKKIIPLVIAVFLLGTGNLFSQKKAGVNIIRIKHIIHALNEW
ncbi:MAG: hypothetical protein IPJ32_01600 [Sphingobacteriaceae bacterium]|nr:hypothetical protein [Sphingobacteriaceae bacterium]